MNMKLYAIPVTIKCASRFVRDHHRHLPRIQGGLFAVGVARTGEHEPCGVAIVARPDCKSEDGWTCTIVRCATDGTRNACSFLYGLCRRIAQAMGYRRCKTFTLERECGASLFAVAAKLEGLSPGGKDARAGRANLEQGPKKAWELLEIVEGGK